MAIKRTINSSNKHPLNCERKVYLLLSTEKRKHKRFDVQADCLQSGTSYMGRGSSHSVPANGSQ